MAVLIAVSFLKINGEVVMIVVKDTKGKVLYRIKNNEIIPEGPNDLKSLHKTIRERKIFINKTRTGGEY